MKVSRSLCFWFLTALLSVSFAAGQTSNLKVYAPVPKHLRGQLNERLKLYAEYVRRQQYELLYDLFSERYVAYMRSIDKDRASKEGYVRFEESLDRRYRLVEFIPTATTKDAKNVYSISVRIREFNPATNQIYEDKGSITAYWQNGQWYFSQHGIDVYDQSGRCLDFNGAPNNGMHPTANSAALIENSRVITSRRGG